MFGKVKHHYNRAVAFGKGAVHYGVQAYHKGVQYASHVDNALKIARQGLHILKPLANELPYGNTALQGAFGGIGQIQALQDKLKLGHDGVLAKIRKGGEVLQRLRDIDPGANSYVM